MSMMITVVPLWTPLQTAPGLGPVDAGTVAMNADFVDTTSRLLHRELSLAQRSLHASLQLAIANHARHLQDLRRRAAEEEQENARAAALATAEEARRPKVVRPADGRFSSGFGARWGTTHLGVDIANTLGTPVVSVADGVVVEAGPASGFGLWIRVRHGDGTVTVYGHVDRILVPVGHEVRAGRQIATMGNRGQSTGPHLHFEVWAGGSRKVDPVSWLGSRGVRL
ncbi:M23 family metallopeptidase [Lentzea sp. DG1S-22]|uniref:M23 family metallopeptidase n=1 Tax=Lentzea sp. DG1S-22 TaxID=3108822 RepID=UPI002E7946E4|nr:M23 family metallopeptidase [Lentzea sp. DG1S-22]WVH82366.1 M23 family metallopeptidase [Lentzea sp. DG1S-22]